MDQLSLPYIRVNGKETFQVSVLDRGFTYGDGLFETCLFSHGKIALWPFHEARLLDSASRLSIAVDLENLRVEIAQVFKILSAHEIESVVIKVMVTRGEGGRGYGAPQLTIPTLVIGVFDAPTYPEKNSTEGVTVKVCETRLGRNKVLAGLKHLNRLEQILARSEWQTEYAEGICLDVNDNVIEGVFSNLFWVDSDNNLNTPDLSFSGVAGVMRANVMVICEKILQISVAEKNCSLTELLSAKEVFMTNSLYGIWPVKSITTDSGQYQFSSFLVSQKIQATWREEIK